MLEVRTSKSGPDQGLIKMRTTRLNQGGKAVQISNGNLLVPRRPARFRHQKQSHELTLVAFPTRERAPVVKTAGSRA